MKYWYVRIKWCGDIGHFTAHHRMAHSFWALWWKAHITMVESTRTFFVLTIWRLKKNPFDTRLFLSETNLSITQLTVNSDKTPQGDTPYVYAQFARAGLPVTLRIDYS